MEKQFAVKCGANDPRDHVATCELTLINVKRCPTYDNVLVDTGTDAWLDFATNKDRR